MRVRRVRPYSHGSSTPRQPPDIAGQFALGFPLCLRKAKEGLRSRAPDISPIAIQYRLTKSGRDLEVVVRAISAGLDDGGADHDAEQIGPRTSLGDLGERRVCSSTSAGPLTFDAGRTQGRVVLHRAHTPREDVPTVFSLTATGRPRRRDTDCNCNFLGCNCDQRRTLRHRAVRFIWQIPG
jgi:hypothetical protein